MSRHLSRAARARLKARVLAAYRDCLAVGRAPTLPRLRQALPGVSDFRLRRLRDELIVEGLVPPPSDRWRMPCERGREDGARSLLGTTPGERALIERTRLEVLAEKLKHGIRPRRDEPDSPHVRILRLLLPLESRTRPEEI